jgi:hypothetical protein
MNDPDRIRKLNTLKLADFDWVKNLDEVWGFTPTNVPELHSRAVEDFSHEMARLLSNKGNSFSPPGIIVAGPGGSGKTHLLMRFANIVFQNKGYFLLADLSRVEDLLETVIEGMVRSLLTPVPFLENKAQITLLTFNILEAVNFVMPPDMAKRHNADPSKIGKDLDKILVRLLPEHPRECAEYSEVLRSILLLNSESPILKRCALNYLYGRPLTAESTELAGFKLKRNGPERVITGLSFFMSLNDKPQVLALDQLDHLLSLYNLLSHSPPIDEGRGLVTETLGLLSNVSDGLGRLPELSRRTITVLSCLPETWNYLQECSLNTSLERYRRPPIFLKPMDSEETARKIVGARMKEAAGKAHHKLPYPGWPFKPESFQGSAGHHPRVILERCHALIRELVLGDSVDEIESIFPSEDPIGEETYIEEAGNARETYGAFGSYEESPPLNNPAQARDPGLVFAWGENTGLKDLLQNTGDLGRGPYGASPPLPRKTLDGSDPYEARPLADKEPFFKSRNPNDPGSTLIPTETYKEEEPISEPEGPLKPPILLRYEELLAEDERDDFKDETNEDTLWPEALEALLSPCLSLIFIPPHKTLTLEFDNDEKIPRVHAYLSSKDDRSGKAEKNLYLRAVASKNYKRLLTRVDKILEYSGIKKRNANTRLMMLRFAPFPSGDSSVKTVLKFENMGGLRSKPSDQDLAILNAVLSLKKEFSNTEFQGFMEKNRPWEKVLFLEESLAWLTAND